MSALPLPLLLSAFAQTVDAPSVSGASTCPSPAEVATQLAGLSPSRASADSHRVFLDADERGRAVRVRLSDQAGQPVAEQALPDEESCRALAETVAVMVAAWLSQIDPQARLAVGRVPTGPAQAAPPAPVSLSIEASAGLDAVSGSAPALGLSALFGRTQQHLRGRIGLFTTGAADAPLDPGTIGWRRTSLLASAVYQARRDPWLLEVGAGPVGGVVVMRGQGFSEDAEAAALDVGVAGSARIGVRLRRLTAAVSLLAVAWLRPQTARVVGRTEVRSLPRASLLYGLSVGFDVSP